MNDDTRLDVSDMAASYDDLYKKIEELRTENKQLHNDNGKLITFIDRLLTRVELFEEESVWKDIKNKPIEEVESELTDMGVDLTEFRRWIQKTVAKALTAGKGE